MRYPVYFLFIILATAPFLKACEKEEDVSNLYEINYADSENWLAKPENINKAVDIFYVYPSVWRKANPEEANIADINAPGMRAGATVVFSQQATAFETIGNIYAPFYRQADAGYALSLSPTERDLFIAGTPVADVEAAFEHYVKYENNNRPYILAGHSQGAQVLLFILSGYFKNHPEVYNRMVAAYIIGYSVTSDYMEENLHLKFAEGADDTGVIISYNTEAPNLTVANPVLLENSLCINPINWSREEILAPAAGNLGSMVLDTLGQVVKAKEMNYADAQINLQRGVVCCSSVNARILHKTNGILPLGVYHFYDFSFYYYNLRANAENRVRNYL